jgi:hypothetical protein
MRKVIVLPDDRDREPNQRIYFENFCKRIQMALEAEGLECELITSIDPANIKRRTT